MVMIMFQFTSWISSYIVELTGEYSEQTHRAGFSCSPLKDKMYLQGTLGAFLSSGTSEEMGSRDLQILDVLALVNIGKLLLRRDLLHASKTSARNTTTVWESIVSWINSHTESLLEP